MAKEGAAHRCLGDKPDGHGGPVELPSGQASRVDWQAQFSVGVRSRAPDYLAPLLMHATTTTSAMFF